MSQTLLFDSHSHTENSHDSIALPEEICLTAIEKGLSGITFSDHCDIQFYTSKESAENIGDSVRAAAEMREKFKGKLEIFTGLELGEAIWNREAAEYISKAYEYDVILGSCHGARYKNYGIPFSNINFSVWNDKDAEAYLGRYLLDVLELASTVDIDVLAHLTVPLKYVNAKHGRNARYEIHMDTIEKTLRTIIERGIALEVNTSGYACAVNSTVPDENILRRYRELGGYLITIGSDAHVASDIGYEFDRTLKLLKDIGFEKYFYFKQRRPIAVDIK